MGVLDVNRDKDGKWHVNVDQTEAAEEVVEEWQALYPQDPPEDPNPRGMPENPIDKFYNCETGRFDKEDVWPDEYDMNHPKQWKMGSKPSWKPYRPFPGEAVKWESNVYDDGTTYEGLAYQGVPIMKGVLVKGNGSGAGLQPGKRGDRYEGDFRFGVAHGKGTYTSADGLTYSGRWLYGNKHGCGMEIDLAPFRKLCAEGMEPAEAWALTKDDIETHSLRGTWEMDEFMHGPDETGKYCHDLEIKGVLQDVENTVWRARQFQFKPDGEVNFMMSQDQTGFPAPVMQDPIHYPHGTKFMAPGPMGQCFPVPDDEGIKDHMIKVAENKERVFNMWNFDYHTKPGSPQWHAEHYWDKLRAENTEWNMLLKDNEEQEEQQADIRLALMPGDQRLGEEIDHRRKYMKKKKPNKYQMQLAADVKQFLKENFDLKTGELLPQKAGGGGQGRQEGDGKGKPKRQKPKDGKGKKRGDQNLVASTDLGTDPSDVCYSSEEEDEGHNARPGGPRRPGGFAGPTVFASMTLSMSRASLGLNKAFERMAVQAQRRRSLTRPT